jgi:hypothetical protein
LLGFNAPRFTEKSNGELGVQAAQGFAGVCADVIFSPNILSGPPETITGTRYTPVARFDELER